MSSLVVTGQAAGGSYTIDATLRCPRRVQGRA